LSRRSRTVSGHEDNGLVRDLLHSTGIGAVCGDRPRRLAEDHDHAARLTLRFLCQSCNILEGRQIVSLLQPGPRAERDARARIRALLAMEAHVEPHVQVSEKDVEGVPRGMRDGEVRIRVFPRLDDIATAIERSDVTPPGSLHPPAGRPCLCAGAFADGAQALQQRL
jgi:hypothetical protein